jgi:hypothetical protein
MLQLEKLIGKNYFLNLSAKEAYKAYVRAYDSHHLKQIFDVETLDLAKVAASFGFQVPPAVDLRILLYAVRISVSCMEGSFTVLLYKGLPKTSGNLTMKKKILP